MNVEKEQIRKSFVEKADSDRKEVLTESGCTEEEYDKALYCEMIECEPDINPADLLMEIYVLIKEYFNGNFTYTESGIYCDFLNGNKFKICTAKAE
ncbi:MAG: hypothetical protein K2O81_00150 [Clostridia bacterium]|nr:hypothetical protein [Clostridia bacterium]